MEAGEPTTGHPHVDEAPFHALMASRAGSLLGLAQPLSPIEPQDEAALARVLTRPFLALMLSQATQLEELLDAYGALNNARWHSFRSTVAAAKLFTRVHYNLLHLQQASPWYQLLEVEGDFSTGTRATLHFTGGVLLSICHRLATEGIRLRLPVHEVPVAREELPSGRLPQDRALRRVLSAGETVAKLATAYLNLAEASEFLARYAAPATAPGSASQPATPGEAELRNLENRFHNLQALYDTYVSNTDVERLDPALRSLRGHISIVYHLLETATDLAHYYERHVHPPVPESDTALQQRDLSAPLVAEHDLRAALYEYALAYAVRYVKAGQSFCQELLKRYAEQGEARLPIPRYRGFHVRPSTLVAKIVNHYGSSVTMTLEDETYDAASPLELFRANEKINALKRRHLATEIAGIVQHLDRPPSPDLVLLVRRVILTLAEHGRIVVYEQPVPAVDAPGEPAGPELTFVVDQIARLQSLGKIDITANLTAVFQGDRRVLADIRLLADHGYGEDSFGNNIPLPKPLAYLRG